MNLFDAPLLKSVSLCADRLHRNIPDAVVIPVLDFFNLKRLAWKATAQVFYVGHGTPDGLRLPAGMLPWSLVSKVVQASPARTHYIAACHSTRVRVEGRLVFGFNSLVDAEAAAATYSALHHILQGSPREAVQALGRFVEEGGLDPQPQETLGPLLSAWCHSLLHRLLDETEIPCTDVGWTPYGLLNPPALHIHWDTADIVNIQQGVLVTDAIFAIYLLAFPPDPAKLTPWGWAAIGTVAFGIFMASGLAATLNAMSTVEGGDVEQYIPLDGVNEALVIATPTKSFYCKTQNHWWIVFYTWGLCIS